MPDSGTAAAAPTQVQGGGPGGGRTRLRARRRRTCGRRCTGDAVMVHGGIAYQGTPAVRLHHRGARRSGRGAGARARPRGTAPRGPSTERCSLMSGRFRRKGLGTVLAACGVAAALAALPTAAAAARAPAAGGAIHGPTVARSLTASTYWTTARLRQAKSIDVAVSPSQARTLRAVPTAKKGLPGRMPPHAVGTKLLTKAAGGGPGFGSTASPWYGSASSAPATTSGRVFFTGNDGL